MPEPVPNDPELKLALYRSLAKIFRSFDLNTVAEEILGTLQRTMGVNYGTLMILSDQGRYVDRVFRAGFGPERHISERFGLTKLEIENLVRDMIPKYREFGAADKAAPVVNGDPMGIVAVFPFQLLYDYSGLLMLAVQKDQRDSTLLKHSGFRLLESVISDYAFALKNAFTMRRMNDLVTKDDLTLSYNRRFFEEHLSEELERARRYNNPLSLIFLDLDGLRVVNNRFGHAMGSRTLQEAAARIMNSVRSIDKTVRYGGDEFCIILPETDWQGAIEVAERIRARLAGSPFLLDETGGIEITGSFGVASYPTHAITKEELVKKADEAMYLIKTQSNNDIQVAQPLKRFPS
ncbi:MAG: GGDEF domain-containing protein [Acidobacteriota bacterium]